jgi:hypothetical protein
MMKVLLYQDDTLNLNLDALSLGLSTVNDSSLQVNEGKVAFRVEGDTLRHPESYEQLSPELLNEAVSADLSFCFTRIPYDNNYFFHSRDNVVIVSFYAWEQLTTLPLENGAVYFVTSLLRFELPLPPAHDEVTGCINDFLWDKTGVDLGMRSGLLCHTCKLHLSKSKLRPTAVRLFNEINRILRDLGTASRNGESIIDYWSRIDGPKTTRPPHKFAVFLCHNGRDKAEVRRVARKLEARGISVWLDEEQLRPGLAWQVLLEEQIGTIETAAVFVGSSGVGPWQDMEIRALLSEFVRRGCPVIPVILPDATEVPELPIFLRQLTWVDFRESPDKAMERLVWGITGKKPRTEATSVPSRRNRRPSSR